MYSPLAGVPRQRRR